MSGIYEFNSYKPIMLSHQTGLSVTVSTANTFYAIGNAISVPRTGLLAFIAVSHVSGGNGYIQLGLTRGSNTYYYGSSSSSVLSNASNEISTTTPSLLFSYYDRVFFIPVLSNDTLQLYATNSTAGDITYIDDLWMVLI
ncbi:MAG: hypothetical protein QW478_11790 [Candidatus Micrarchaeaceae archaeon]